MIAPCEVGLALALLREAEVGEGVLAVEVKACRASFGRGSKARSLPSRIGTVIERGDEAPDFEAPDQDGRAVKLSDFRGTPGVVLLSEGRGIGC